VGEETEEESAVLEKGRCEEKRVRNIPHTVA
jgi:hypothetical protein